MPSRTRKQGSKRRRATGVRRKTDGTTSTARRKDVGSLKASVGAIFRSARELQRLSQDEVAALTAGMPGELSRTTISSIERGTSLPGLETLVSLSRTLHVQPMDVLERVDLAMTDPIDLTGVSLDEMRRQAEGLFWSGDYRGALAVYDTIYECLVLEASGDSAEQKRNRAEVEIRRAVALRQCSALNSAKAAAERATELARCDPCLQAEAYMVLASLHAHEGLFALAKEAAELAVRLAVDGDSKLLGLVWSQNGNVLHRAGEFEAARQAFLHARKFARSAKDARNIISIEGNIGACLMDLGRRAQARKRFVVAVELARKHADPAAEAFWLVELGRLALDAGDSDEADRLARAAVQIAKPTDRVLTIFRAEWLRHLVMRRSHPGGSDRRRLQYLKKLYARVREHRGTQVIREFEEQVFGGSRRTGGSGDA